jgi:hypothetical protein
MSAYWRSETLPSLPETTKDSSPTALTQKIGSEERSATMRVGAGTGPGEEEEEEALASVDRGLVRSVGHLAPQQACVRVHAARRLRCGTAERGAEKTVEEARKGASAG